MTKTVTFWSAHDKTGEEMYKNVLIETMMAANSDTFGDSTIRIAADMSALADNVFTFIIMR